MRLKSLGTVACTLEVIWPLISLHYHVETFQRRRMRGEMRPISTMLCSGTSKHPKRKSEKPKYVCWYCLDSNGVDASYGILRLNSRILLWHLSFGPSWQEQLLLSASKNRDLTASAQPRAHANTLQLPDLCNLAHTHSLSHSVSKPDTPTSLTSVDIIQNSEEKKWMIYSPVQDIIWSPSNTHTQRCPTLLETLRVNRLPASYRAMKLSDTGMPQ